MTGSHPSDDPGTGATPPERGTERHRSSGPSGGNMPRRPGTGERQAERRDYSGDEPHVDEPLIPGEVLCGDGPLMVNAGMDVISMRVENTADRPIQVGSHYHFAEVNPALQLDREAAWGRRLNVVSGGSVRFEPGAAEEVELVPIAGQRIVAGLRGECGGSLDG